MLAEMLAAGSGGGNASFEIAPFVSSGTTRTSISSQNCYIYNDGGTAKAHIEVTFTALVTISSGGACLMDFPVQKSLTKNLTIEGVSHIIRAEDNMSYFTRLEQISSGTSLSYNFDYEL